MAFNQFETVALARWKSIQQHSKRTIKLLDTIGLHGIHSQFGTKTMLQPPVI